MRSRPGLGSETAPQSANARPAAGRHRRRFRVPLFENTPPVAQTQVVSCESLDGRQGRQSRPMRLDQMLPGFNGSTAQLMLNKLRRTMAASLIWTIVVHWNGVIVDRTGISAERGTASGDAVAEGHRSGAGGGGGFAAMTKQWTGSTVPQCGSASPSTSMARRRLCSDALRAFGAIRESVTSSTSGSPTDRNKRVSDWLPKVHRVYRLTLISHNGWLGCDLYACKLLIPRSWLGFAGGKGMVAGCVRTDGCVGWRKGCVRVGRKRDACGAECDAGGSGADV